MALFTEEKQATVIEFLVPAVPVAQPRPRATQGFNGHARIHEVTDIVNIDADGKKVRKPHPIAAFKATVRLAAAEAYRDQPPLDCPLVVDLVFVFPRVKPGWLKKTSSWFSMWQQGERIPQSNKKNDLDNLIKSTFDALTGTVWVDDGLIYACHVEKWIAAADEQPHVEVRIVAGE